MRYLQCKLLAVIFSYQNEIHKENKMEINNAQDLKALIITEVLEAYAEKTGKCLEHLAEMFIGNELFRNEIMQEVGKVAKALI